MKKLMLFLFLGAVLLLSFFVYKKRTCESCSANPLNSSLIVGTNAQFPPYEFLKDGDIVGFDIDLVHEIGRRLQRPVTIKDLDFDMLLLEAQTGNIHIIAAALTPTPERAQKLLFTKKYIGGDPLVIISNPNLFIKTVDDLQGKEVVVNEGFTADRYVSQYPNVLIKRLPTVADAFLALSLGRADAFVSARSAVEPFLHQYASLGLLVAELPVTEEYALGVSKKYEELYDPINKILEQIIEDGTLKKMQEKWHILP